MLTPTGMAKADPLASNDTVEGKAQSRRVSVNVLVSKTVDVMWLLLPEVKALISPAFASQAIA